MSAWILNTNHTSSCLWISLTLHRACEVVNQSRTSSCLWIGLALHRACESVSHFIVLVNLFLSFDQIPCGQLKTQWLIVHLHRYLILILFWFHTGNGLNFTDDFDIVQFLINMKKVRMQCVWNKLELNVNHMRLTSPELWEHLSLLLVTLIYFQLQLFG